MTSLFTAVLRVVTGAMLPLANLMGHLTVFAGLFAILMGRFAAVVPCFTATMPIVLTFLLFHLALSVLAFPQMFPVMVWRRRRFTVMVRRRRRRRFPGVWRWRPRLCADLHIGPQPQN